jgi:hypothetical protein
MVEKRSNILKIIFISCSGLVTLTIGLNLGDIGSKIALFLSVLVTAISGLDAHFSYRNKLVILSTLIGRLSKIHLELQYIIQSEEFNDLKLIEIKEEYLRLYEEYQQENVKIVANSIRSEQQTSKI